MKIYPGNSYAYRIRALIYLAMDKKQKACADLATAIDRGFTKIYGDEVKELQKKNCR